MAEVQIAQMRISHELILNWLVLNPEKTQGDCAQHFGITEAWLSVVINSDVFKARWEQRKAFMADQTDKLMIAQARGVVSEGLQKLEKLVKDSQDPAFVLQTTDKLMGRLGFGHKPAGMQVQLTQNNLLVDAATVAAARASILSAAVSKTDDTPETLDVTPQSEQS